MNVQVGDSIVYAVKHSSSVSINKAVVTEVHPDRLRVRTTTMDWRGRTREYDATLRASNFVVTLCGA
jgi:hypothetical protein